MDFIVAGLFSGLLGGGVFIAYAAGGFVCATILLRVFPTIEPWVMGKLGWTKYEPPAVQISDITLGTRIDTAALPSAAPNIWQDQPGAFERLDTFMNPEILGTTDEVATQFLKHVQKAKKKKKKQAEVEKIASERQLADLPIASGSPFRLLHDYATCKQCGKQRRTFHVTGHCGRCATLPPEDSRAMAAVN